MKLNFENGFYVLNCLSKKIIVDDLKKKFTVNISSKSNKSINDFIKNIYYVKKDGNIININKNDVKFEETYKKKNKITVFHKRRRKESKKTFSQKNFIISYLMNHNIN